MSRGTDTSSLSLVAELLSDLNLETLTGGERLNTLDSMSLQGNSSTSLTLSNTVASHLSATLHNDSQQRPLDALVAEIHQLPADATADRFQLVLRPWLWWLTLASNNRVFQNLATSDIVTTIFKAHGFTDFKLSLTGSYEPREYCVQYGETDFAFVSRLLEEEGIFWFFIHEVGKHTLVLADSNDAFPPIPNGPKVPYLDQEIGVRELHGIRSAQYCLQAVAGTYSATDYEFTTPSTSLYSQAQAEAGPRARYEHPGGYTAKGRGDALTKQRVDGLRSQEKRLIGESDCRWLVPGHWFTLSGHDDDSLNIDWVLTSVTHDASHAHYRNRFEAIPKATAYRPARVTPKPRMHTQTALVVGKAGEEIWTDQYGRVKVHFHWDRHDQSNENSSCWIRVSQAWAGKNWGSMQIPRIGQEVIVSFLEGDPDRPIITGRVYNAEQTVPYELPANATQSGMKSRSSKGGTPANFNEIRMEDKKGAEQLYIHAERNQDNLVENDASLSVGHDRNKSIGHDELARIGNNRTRAVKLNDTLLVGGAKSDSVTGTYLIEAGAQIRLVCGKSVVEFNADGTINISGSAFNLYASGNGNIDTGGRLDLNSGGASEVDAKGKVVQGTIDVQVQAMFPPPAKG
ncbi:MAG: type VI secretion system tip protein VgrG [Pseudomonas aeruginosa]|nr:type VI secretion system tip protein VgrG [Pseudomonas aeruginosa]